MKIQMNGLIGLKKLFLKTTLSIMNMNISVIFKKLAAEVYRANWKTSHAYFALKSFFNLNGITVKEIVNEVILEKSMCFGLYNS